MSLLGRMVGLSVFAVGLYLISPGVLVAFAGVVIYMISWS